MRRALSLALALIASAAVSVPVYAGHEVTYYPSFYPHEIRIESIDPASAAASLKDKGLHAYFRSAPRLGASPPGHLKGAESLDSYLLLTLNPASERFRGREGRCAAARGILAVLARDPRGFVFHPHPVTPYHADFLHQLDRVRAAQAEAQAETPAELPLRFRVRGPRAEALVRPPWHLERESWEASLEEVPAEELMSPLGLPMNGWTGPPWAKEGWHHAYQLLAPGLSDREARGRAESLYGRLVWGGHVPLAERLTLERRLLLELTRDCGRMVVGYIVRRELYNDDWTSGVENVGLDSHLGLNSPIFIRTVKLKDFPWNGVLRLGVEGKAEAAWNPVAGFTDAPGRLLWWALADPAFMPLPFNSSWVPNRIDVEGPGAVEVGPLGGIPVSPEALLPHGQGGELKPVGKGKVAAAKVTYRVLASPFRDGTPMEVADLLYAYVFAHRWGRKAGPEGGAHDPSVGEAASLVRERLAGVRPLGVERAVLEVADQKFAREVPVVEVYVNYVSPDPRQVAASAPPWSAVPWHLLVLMEAAVEPGYAAFSREEAERRGVPWLDLVRDERLKALLRELVEGFEREGYRPAALSDRVSPEAARGRWAALRSFAARQGHFLVTNGPYRLKAWSKGATELEVVRDFSYPVGLGTFNRYVNPPRAVVTGVNREAGRVAVEVDLERVVKAQRAYSTVRERLSPGALSGVYQIHPASRFLLVAPDGSVVWAGPGRLGEEGGFVASLPAELPPGQYTLLLGIYLDGNAVNAGVTAVPFQAGGP